jgi:large subunit ribosomal protein L1
MAEAKNESDKKKTAKEPKITKEKQLKEAEIVAEPAPIAEPAEVETEITEPDASTQAKAGKRSAKATREAEAKEQKQERKAKAEESPKEASKIAKKPTRPKAERAGKKYREAAKLVDNTRIYPLGEALELATKTSTTKFDSTVELHINLGVDPKQADQNVRDTVVLPAGTGKTIRIAVLADSDGAKLGKAAGADLAGEDELLAQLEKEQIEFDVLIATPSMMPKLGKYARLLGPRGLMPNPKSGTVTTDVAKAVNEAKAGRVEYRVDQAGIIHLGIGKVSFGAAKLEENASAVLSSIRAAKPASLKGTYLKAGFVTTSMGPGIRIEL